MAAQIDRQGLDLSRETGPHIEVEDRDDKKETAMEKADPGRCTCPGNENRLATKRVTNEATTRPGCLVAGTLLHTTVKETANQHAPRSFKVVSDFEFMNIIHHSWKP
ncbi:hypothetical protein SUNI508_04916 [Seiridium unicorne]|uniref:Uncharacterized protein n=1 Tax=Seiridium unicorne TaxID=138068 RepID=A0ABR2V5P9_9PEZI